LSRIGEGAADKALRVAEARDRLQSLIELSESLVQGTVAAGGMTQDQRFIDRVTADASTLGQRLEMAVTTGEISLEDLFDRDYSPIPGTDPEQVRAPFTHLTDRLFPEIQEAALEMDDRIVFCAAVATGGYLPTHNAKFSQPQGNDPVWNTAHCRNRRIFDDRVGAKASLNTQPFLLQVYRRDMGGGEFRMMTDLSAPIFVQGRHWGGLRLAYLI
jgi:methyl-accepting chemotaxis protein